MRYLIIALALCLAGCVTPGSADRAQTEYETYRAVLDRLMMQIPNTQPADMERLHGRIQAVINILRELEEDGAVEPEPVLGPAPVVIPLP
jgi:starvation-inducible outer membrane lipoprotein